LSPRARRFAAQHGIQASDVAGSGPGGRVLEADLKRAYFSQPRLSSLARAQLEGSGPGGMVLARDLPVAPALARAAGGIREKIARRLRESLATTAQYTLHSSAGAAGLLAMRARIKVAGRDPDVNINELVTFCAVKALLRMPELNAEFVDGKLHVRPQINIGFACDTPRGLLVPVVRNCGQLALEDLSRKMKELARQAVEGGISPDDLNGATFTISNLGNLGIESFTPILNPPQVAILGIDSIELRPVRRNEQIEFMDRIGLSLTLDHQVIDGAPGARFLLVVRECIENVEALCTTSS
jgi:pyruvate dehydrogenase E2 component (dihydrolipoamide acetyltransferase)